MADRSFTLIGNFTDNITPKINQVNKSLESMRRTMQSFSNRNTGFSSITKSIGKVVSAYKHLAAEQKNLRSEISQTNNSLRQQATLLNHVSKEAGRASRSYRHLTGQQKALKIGINDTNSAMRRHFVALDGLNTKVGKSVGAHRRLTTEQGKLRVRMDRTNSSTRQQSVLLNRVSRSMNSHSSSWERANIHAQGYANTLKGMRGNTPPPPFGGGGGGGGRGGYGGGGGNRGGGGGGYGGSVSRDASFAFGQILGNQVAGVMTNAITQGFQIGVGLMQKPFQYFASALGERIKDEQSDIKAAGGYFSISIRQQKPFVKTFAEAMQFTQENNKYMAILAGALPGNTQTYIEVGKRISDSVSRIVMSNTETARAYANQLRADPNRTGGVAAAITDTGAKGARQTITELLGTLTKKTVLAGLGGGGAGGVAGAYGLPGLSERLLTQQDVTMGQFRRYAAIFRDPMISDALERYLPKINATSATTIERFKAVDKMFDEVLPPEMIRAYERSTSGILEAYNTLFLGPETGFLGLGRKLKGLGKKMDDFGRYVDADGVVTNFAGAVEAELSIFDMLKDVFANFGISLFPIIEFLPTLFDPLVNIGKTLVDLRHYSGKFLSNFDAYKNGLMDYAKSLEKGGNKLQAEKILSNVSLRATLATINNAFRSAGIFDMTAFTKNADKIMAADFDAGAMVKSFMETFMTSDAAKRLGTQIGTTVKTVLIFVSSVLDQFIGVANAGKLVSGFKKGFGKEGKEAVSNIIRKVFQGIAKALYTVFQAAPLEFTIAGIVMLGLPALMGGLSVALGSAIEGWMDNGIKNIPNRVSSMANKFKNRQPSVASPVIKGGVKPSQIPRFESAVTPKPNLTTPTNVPFRPVTGGMMKHPQFPWIGVPRPDVLGVTGPYKAPRLPKPPRGAPKGLGSLFQSGKFAETAVRTQQAFKGLTGKILIIGGIIETVTSLLSGKSLEESASRGIGTTVGAAVGGALGLVLTAGNPIGAVVGSMIGGWLGTLQPVVDVIQGIIMAITSTLGPTFEFLGGAISSVIGIFADWFTMIVSIIPGFTKFSDSVSLLDVVFIALKIALYPIVAVAYALQMSLLGLQLGIVSLDKWINNTFQGGDRQGRLAAKQNKLIAEMETASVRMEGVNDNLLKGVPPSKPAKPNDRGAVPKATPAQKPLQNLATSATNATKGVDKTIKVMPPAASTGVAKALTKMSTVEASAALAKKISEMPTPRSPKPTFNIWKQGGVTAASGSLGDALHSEMRNKPSGSSLVIANSSETVIPAAGGLGMSDFMRTLNTGFYTLTNRFRTLGQGLSNLRADYRNYAQVSSATVRTFTTNSREMGFGGGATVNAPISIYQQPGQDPEELAAIVVARLSMAVESLSNYV